VTTNKNAHAVPLPLKGDHEMTTTHDIINCRGCIGLMLESVGMIALSALAFAAPLVLPIMARI